MLSRAATRALRPRAPVLLRPPPARAYAKVGRPQSPRLVPEHKPDVPKNKTAAPEHKTPVPEHSTPVHPAQQPEFDTASDPAANTAPDSSTRPRPASASATVDEAAQAEPAVTPQPEEAASQPASTPPPADPASQPADARPQQPLPDLRFGIPSTFAAEQDQTRRDGSPDPADSASASASSTAHPSFGGGGRELPKSAYETSTDRRRNRVANWGYLATLLFGTLGAAYMGRPWDSPDDEAAHPDVPNGWSPALAYARAAARINGQKAYYTEPTFQKLLPDKDKIPGGAPELTLVLSLEDLLLHSEWSTKHGYRLAKRPGLDYFLRYLSSQYELVIFTTVKSMDADPIIRKLDPFRLVMWPLFREATRFDNGDYVKDLAHLNRDPSKVIVIDTDPAHVRLQPENAIVLPKWKGDPADTGLVALIPFLEYLAMMSATGQPLDVRKALESMRNKDIPTEYARREASLRASFAADRAAAAATKKPSAGAAFMKSLGLDAAAKPPAMHLGDHNLAQGLADGKMMIDMYRDFNVQNYKHLDQQIRENGEAWLKEMADEEKKMQDAAVKDMKAGALGWLGGVQKDGVQKDGAQKVDSQV